MNQDQEQQLRSIEYHLEVAQDVTQPAIVMHHAKNDLIQTDVPFLLELVRSLAEELETSQAALKRAESGKEELEG